jgi:hypothetical protein
MDGTFRVRDATNYDTSIPPAFAECLNMTVRLLVLAFSIVALPRLGAAPTELDSPDYRKAKELVHRFRDDRFSVREAASKQLLVMGRAAKRALLEAKDDADAEVAQRCRRLLPLLIAEDLKARIDAFTADTDGKQEHDLPGWKRYQKLVGKEKESRELFAQMLKTNSRIFEQYEFEPTQFGSLYAARCAELAVGGGGRLRSPPPTVGDAAMLFFFDSDPEFAKPGQNNRYLGNLLYQPVFRTALRDPKSVPLRTLFFLWMESRDDPNTVTVALTLVQEFALKEGIPLTIRIVNDKLQNSYYRAQAITVLGKLGSKEHGKDLTNLFTDDLPLQPFNLKGKNGTVQLRDVALAMAIHLHGQKPKEFGFEFVDNESNLWSYYNLGFESDEKREASLKKWKNWAEDQNKK